MAFAYRYRIVHAITEKFARLFARLLADAPGEPLTAKPKRILILKFGGLGEAILAHSLMCHLSERNPEMSFDFLVEDRTLEAMTLGCTGKIHRYSPKSDGLRKAFGQLLEIRRAKYDAVLDFEQHSLLTAAFVRATSIPIRCGFIPAMQSARDRMFTHTVQLREGESMWKAFLHLGRIVDSNLPEEISSVPLHCSVDSEAWLEGWLSDNKLGDTGGSLVALHLGVGPSAQYRMWPMDRFVDLASALAERLNGMTIVLTGSKLERSLIRQFQERFQGRSVDASDLGSIERTATLLRRCDLMVSGDTGIMHLAAAMGTPTVGLFGPNTPACWAPVGPRATYVYSTNQACSPCINSYRREIPQDCTAEQHGACMWDISVQDVLGAVRTVTDSSSLDDFGIGPLTVLH